MRDLPRIRKPMVGLSYFLSLVFVIAIAVTFVGWFLVK